MMVGRGSTNIQDRPEGNSVSLASVSGTREVHVGGKILVPNRSDAGVRIPKATQIASWGRGSFKNMTDTALQNLTQGQVLFNLGGSDDLVMYNKQLRTCGSVYYEKLSTAPESKIAYHKLSETQPGKAFKCERVVNVVFNPTSDSDPVEGEPAGDEGKMPQKGADKDEGKKAKKVSVNNSALLLEKSSWSGGLLSIVWIVRWGPLGLTPMKPVVLVRSPVEIDAHSAVQLNQA